MPDSYPDIPEVMVPVFEAIKAQDKEKLAVAISKLGDDTKKAELLSQVFNGGNYRVSAIQYTALSAKGNLETFNMVAVAGGKIGPRTLALAAANKKIDIVNAIIKKDPSLIKETSDNGRPLKNLATPLIVAAYSNKESFEAMLGTKEGEEALLTADEFGDLPIHHIVRLGEKDTLEKVLAKENGSKTIDKPNKSGITPLMTSIIWGREDATEILSKQIEAKKITPISQDSVNKMAAWIYKNNPEKEQKPLLENLQKYITAKELGFTIPGNTEGAGKESKERELKPRPVGTVDNTVTFGLGANGPKTQEFLAAWGDKLGVKFPGNTLTREVFTTLTQHKVYPRLGEDNQLRFDRMEDYRPDTPSEKQKKDQGHDKSTLGKAADSLGHFLKDPVGTIGNAFNHPNNQSQGGAHAPHIHMNGGGIRITFGNR